MNTVLRISVSRQMCILLMIKCILLASCQKKDPVASPESQLPAATQVGANTFGCLLNGQPFTPNGSDGSMGSNFTVVYDPTFNFGEINIVAFRYTTPKKQNTYQRISIYVDKVNGIGTYDLSMVDHREGLFEDRQKQCIFYMGDPHFRKGKLTITRLDAAKGIIAGTFDFTLYKPGCDSIVITKGRFDKKL